MRETLIAALILMASAASAAAQTSKIEIGPVVRLDRIFIEGDATGNTPVAGVAATFQLSKSYGIETELTQATGLIERSYEGRFVSYVTNPAPTREETEQLAPVARRTLGYEPRAGFSVTFRAGGDISQRVAITAHAGATARRYTETSRYAILSIPDGVDPARVARDHQDSSSEHWRGGLLFGFDTPIAMSRHFSLTPEVRLVYGGPARIGDKYREVGVGLRCGWRF